MSNAITEEKPTLSEVEAHPTSADIAVYHDEKIDDRARAINAEQIEHDMTVLQAVKAYPAASWWAFVMSCTIVSYWPMKGFCHDWQIIYLTW